MSQQARHGRHARLDEPDGSPPPAPGRSTPVASLPQRVKPEPSSAGRTAPRTASRTAPRTVGEYVALRTIPGPSGPGFGEWPFGGHRRDDGSGGPGGSEDPDGAEDAGPNPYLPCEDEAPEIRLAPGGLPGTLAFLAGVVGLALALVPFIAIAVWPLTILGIVLGVVGLRRFRRGSARSPVAAVVGVVLSAAGLALCVAWLSMFAVAGVGAAGLDAVPALVR